MNEIDEARMDQADLEHFRDLPGNQQGSTLLSWLTGRNKRRSTLAVNILARSGNAGTDLLLSEAFAKGKSTRQRLCLLAAIAEVGHPLDEERWWRLMDGMIRFGGAVGKEIMRLMVWNQPGASQSASVPTAAAGTPSWNV
jgi:hypothetical protein